MALKKTVRGKQKVSSQSILSKNKKEAKEREKPNPFIMKKKQGKGKSPTLTDIFLKGYNK